MTTKISIQQIIASYEIEFTFIEKLEEVGRLEIQSIDSEAFIEENQLDKLEKMLRMRSELNLNAEGIDSVLYLLERMESLQSELANLRERLQFFEGEEL